MLHCLQKPSASHSTESTSFKPAQPQIKRKQDDEGKVGSTPKRKKTDGPDPAGTGAATPGSSSGRKVSDCVRHSSTDTAYSVHRYDDNHTSEGLLQPFRVVLSRSEKRNNYLDAVLVYKGKGGQFRKARWGWLGSSHFVRTRNPVSSYVAWTILPTFYVIYCN